MSRIGENIRKITKAWGGKTTGSGIGDALEDLYNNLPFAQKTEMVKIVPLQSVTTEESDGWAYAELSPSDLLKGLMVGETYTVQFNGTEYKCVAWEHADWNAVVLGNGSIFGAEGKGEDVPFVCDSYPEDKDICVNTAMPETCTISITGPVTSYTHIDPNYLPMGEVLGKVFIVEAGYDEDDNEILSKTFDEMNQLIDEGYTLFLDDHESGQFPMKMSSVLPSAIKFMRFYSSSLETDLKLYVMEYECTDENEIRCKNHQVRLVVD